MKKLLGVVLGWTLFAGAASAQEVPLNIYVGDGAVGAKVYDNGFLACDATANECKIGNGVADWDSRPGFVGGGAAGAILQDGTTGFDITASSETASFTPPIASCQAASVTITGGTGNFTINAPTGTAPTGSYQCLYYITNQSGATRTIVFGDIQAGTGRLTNIELADGAPSGVIAIYTTNAGTNWYYDGGDLDFSALPAISPEVDDLVLCQDVSETPDAWKGCRVDGLASGLALTDTNVLGNSTVTTVSIGIDADDHGRTIVCNSPTDIGINVHQNTTAWAPDRRVYVLNIGAGNCIVQDGVPVDVVINVQSGFSSTFPRYSGGTIIGVNASNVVVTGGAAQ